MRHSSLQPECLTRVLVLAIGNPLRGDDGVGWVVARALESEPIEHTLVKMQMQLTPELADDLSRAEHLIVVDAALNVPPGEWRTADVRMEMYLEPLSHQLEVQEVLQLSQALYGRAPRTKVVSVGGVSFEHGERLTPEVEAIVPDVVDAVRDLALEIASSRG